MSRAIVDTQLDARGDSSNPLPIGHQVRHGGGRFLFKHRQSLRRIAELSLHALDSCHAWPQGGDAEVP